MTDPSGGPPAPSPPPAPGPAPQPPAPPPRSRGELPRWPTPPQGRPPWWPQNEAWPPVRVGGDAGRTFLRRVGCFLLFVFVVIPTVGGFIGWLFNGGGGRRDRGDDGPPFGVFVLLILVVMIVFVVRAVRRTAAPIGDVMAAADRVAGGDYTVRVEERGSHEVRRLVAAFNEMAARLQTNETQRRALLADVAHELRTPLAVIRGNVEGMIDGVYPRDDAHLVPLLDETAVMNRLLDDLRTLSLAEAGALRLHREPTEVDELVADVAAAFAPRAAERRLALATDVALLPPLDADPVRLRQILENLVANALRHTPPGGSIRVAARLDGATVAFAVCDTGSGIPPEDLPHVFDRFWKSADSGGSGLGLAIAKNLVAAHGGAIRAESEPGRGTVIRFTMPVG